LSPVLDDTDVVCNVVWLAFVSAYNAIAAMTKAARTREEIIPDLILLVSNRTLP